LLCSTSVDSKEDILPLRVLLVEDHPDLAAATSEFLEAEGLDVRTALSGGEALEIAPAFRPQLTFCDLNLPDMTGLDVVRELRSNAATEGTYVVILTGLGRAELPPRTEADRLRVDAFVAKPLTIELIRTLVEKLS
jgi:CheY-like chemotaxis protein